MMCDYKVALSLDGFVKYLFRDVKTQQRGGDPHLRITNLKTCVVITFLQRLGSKLLNSCGYIGNFHHLLCLYGLQYVEWS